MGNLLSAIRKRSRTAGDRVARRGGSQKGNLSYGYIPDYYKTLDEVTRALREAGLESSNLILGIDFTKSNEWTGTKSFNNRSLHAIGDIPNPYEKAISIIGKTLAPFDEDNLIPCFGFGDATTYDHEVFSFHNNNSPCHGFEEVLACYRRIVPHLQLSGPTSYGPVIDAAVDIVERSGGRYHVLVIIADGQVTRSVDTSDGKPSPQEEKTINSIVDARKHPLSIVLVGVGDGPWDDMKKFDDKLPIHGFDNFQFVNFTAIMEKTTSSSEKETAFALAALMEIPIQYKAAIALRLLGYSALEIKDESLFTAAHLERASRNPHPLNFFLKKIQFYKYSCHLKKCDPPNCHRIKLKNIDEMLDHVQMVQITKMTKLIQIYKSVTFCTDKFISSPFMVYHSHITGEAKKINPKPPPVENTGVARLPARQPSNISAAAQNDQNQACPICLTNRKDLAFGCGHMTCRECSTRLSNCPICRQHITSRIRVYT